MATAKWIDNPVTRLKFQCEDNATDPKALDWYERFFNAGIAKIVVPEVSYYPDASFGAWNKGIRPMVLEVADSRKSKVLKDLAIEYLGGSKGLIKYMFGIDFREVAHGVDVDFITWEHIKDETNKHSAGHRTVYVKSSCFLFDWYISNKTQPLVRVDGTQIDTTATISYPLSHIIGNPPEGCDDVKIELRIADLIKKITLTLARKELGKNNLNEIKLVPGESKISSRLKEQQEAIQDYEKYDSRPEDYGDEENDLSYQPSP